MKAKKKAKRKSKKKGYKSRKKIKAIFPRIDPIVKDILSDFISTFKKKLYISSKDNEWRATVFSPSNIPVDLNRIMQGEVDTEAKGEDYWDSKVWSYLNVRLWISFDEFVTAEGVASLGDIPHLYVSCNPDEKYGIRLENILKFCEVLNKETDEVIVLASVSYSGNSYIGYEKTWPSHPPTLSIVRPR